MAQVALERRRPREDRVQSHEGHGDQGLPASGPALLSQGTMRVLAMRLLRRHWRPMPTSRSAAHAAFLEGVITGSVRVHSGAGGDSDPGFPRPRGEGSRDSRWTSPCQWGLACVCPAWASVPARKKSQRAWEGPSGGVRSRSAGLQRPAATQGGWAGFLCSLTHLTPSIHSFTPAI